MMKDEMDEKMQKEMTAGFVKMGIKEDEITDKMLWGAHKMMYGIAKVKMGLKEIGWDDEKIAQSIGEMSQMFSEQEMKMDD